MWGFGLTELSALQEFEEDVRDFKLKVDDTDRRLGAIFCQAFDDASGLDHAFKVPELNLSFAQIHKHNHNQLSKPFHLSDVCRFWICLVAYWSAL